MIITDNDRLSIMGLYPIPTASLTAGDVQQFILYRNPLAVIIGSRSVISNITGNGLLTSTFDIHKLILSSISGNGLLPTVLTTSRILSSVINAGGTLITQIDKAIPIASTVRGNGLQATLIAKQMQQLSIIQGNGLLTSTFDVMKTALSSVSGNTSGIIVNIAKSTAVVSNVKGNGLLIDSILVNKKLQTITISGGGVVKTIYIRKFKDNSIIFINLDLVINHPSRVFETILGKTVEDFIVYGTY